MALTVNAAAEYALQGDGPCEASKAFVTFASFADKLKKQDAKASFRNFSKTMRHTNHRID